MKVGTTEQLIGGPAAPTNGAERRAEDSPMREYAAAEVHLNPDLPHEFMGDPEFDAMLRTCRQILGIKGREYVAGSTDRLANFRQVGEFLGMDPKAALATYMWKHLASIFSYIRTNKAYESEPIEGRIADAINYLLLLYRMIKEEETHARNKSGEVLGKGRKDG